MVPNPASLKRKPSGPPAVVAAAARIGPARCDIATCPLRQRQQPGVEEAMPAQASAAAAPAPIITAEEAPPGGEATAAGSATRRAEGVWIAPTKPPPPLLVVVSGSASFCPFSPTSRMQRQKNLAAFLVTSGVRKRHGHHDEQQQSNNNNSNTSSSTHRSIGSTSTSSSSSSSSCSSFSSSSSSSAGSASQRPMPFLWTAGGFLSTSAWAEPTLYGAVLEELYRRIQDLVDDPSIAFVTARQAARQDLMRCSQLRELQPVLRLAVKAFGGDVSQWLESVRPPQWTSEMFKMKREAVACWAILTHLLDYATAQCKSTMLSIVRPCNLDRVGSTVRFPPLAMGPPNVNGGSGSSSGGVVGGGGGRGSATTRVPPLPSVREEEEEDTTAPGSCCRGGAYNDNLHHHHHHQQEQQRHSLGTRRVSLNAGCY